MSIERLFLQCTEKGKKVFNENIENEIFFISFSVWHQTELESLIS